MDRRQFLRGVMLWSAGMAVSVPRFSAAAVPAAPQRPRVAVAEDRDYRRLVDLVLEALGGMGQFVRNGDRVVVKPNIGWDRSPQQAANTHPQVVKGIIVHALEAGAARVLVFDRTCNEPRRCYTNSGIEEAVRSLKNSRVRVEHVDDRKFIPVDIERGKAVSRLEIYRDALEADSYINVPVAKHHGLSRLTLSLKNSMGVLGGNRGMMHHDLGQKLADLATVLRPALNVVDATRILLDNGPQGGSLDDVRVMDTLIASADPVAADAYATTLFGLRPEQIGSTAAAHRMGLGEMDLERMEIITRQA